MLLYFLLVLAYFFKFYTASLFQLFLASHAPLEDEDNNTELYVGNGVGVFVAGTGEGVGVSVAGTGDGVGVSVAGAGDGVGVLVAGTGEGVGVLVAGAGEGVGVLVAGNGEGVGVGQVTQPVNGVAFLLEGPPVL